MIFRDEGNLEFDQYAEPLDPARVQIHKRVGDVILVIEVDGYRGRQTGDAYYSRDVRKYIDDWCQVYSDQIAGLEITSGVPQILMDQASESTDYYQGDMDTSSDTNLGPQAMVPVLA